MKMSSFNLIFLNFVFLLTLSSCATLHTGPLLMGDIPIPFGRMQEGKIYRDPKNRFEVPCPYSNAVVNRTKYGVTFSDTEGVDNYYVLAYDFPSEFPTEVLTIDAVLKGIKYTFQQKGLDIRIAKEEKIEYKGREALGFNFYLDSKDKNTDSRIYVTLFVKTDNFVYWLNYSIADIFRRGVVGEHNIVYGKKFFDSVKFEKEF